MKFLRRHFPHLSRHLFGHDDRRRSRASDRGAALMLATFALALILYIAMEVQYETQVEFSVNKASVNKLKAYYSARSGVELSLLRIKLYQKTKAQMSGMQGVPTAMLDLIWSFPFSWPPMMPPDMNAVDQGQIDAIVKEAKLDGSYQIVISDEGTKIDINDLDSSSKTIREATKKLILQLFENEFAEDTAWAKAHQNFQAEDVVNNIIDWLDADTQSLKSGDERGLYPNASAENPMPPNRQFRTVEELRMVAGVTEDVFKLLAPRITVYGAKAINPNTAPPEVIQGLHNSITNEVLAEVLKRRADIMGQGQFRDAQDFWSFLDSKGARVPLEIQETTPISTESAMNFRIKSVGSYANSVAEIEAVTYDIPRAAAAVATELKKEKTGDDGGAGGGGATPPANPRGGGAPKIEVPKGPPRIVFWTER